MIGLQFQLTEIILSESIPSFPQRVLELAIALARSVVVQFGVFAQKAHLGRMFVPSLHLHAQLQPWSRLFRVRDFIFDVFDRTTVVLARHRLRAVDDRRRFLQGKLQARRRLGRRRRRIRARLLSLRRPILARVVDASSASSSTAHDARARRRLSRRGESPQTSTRRIDDDGRRSGGKARETRGEVRQ